MTSFASISLDQVAVVELLTWTEHPPTIDAVGFGRAGTDAGVGGESGCSILAYRRWLECAFERASSASTRRLIEDVLDDISAIGPIDDELESLVIGALASVETALECDEYSR